MMTVITERDAIRERLQAISDKEKEMAERENKLEEENSCLKTELELAGADLESANNDLDLAHSKLGAMRSELAALWANEELTEWIIGTLESQIWRKRHESSRLQKERDNCLLELEEERKKSKTSEAKVVSVRAALDRVKK